jgi:hypothetical protein
MSIKPNPKEINIILNILKGAQFEFLPRAPFYIDTPLVSRFDHRLYQFMRLKQTAFEQQKVLDITRIHDHFQDCAQNITDSAIKLMGELTMALTK